MLPSSSGSRPGTAGAAGAAPPGPLRSGRCALRPGRPAPPRPARSALRAVGRPLVRSPAPPGRRPALAAFPARSLACPVSRWLRSPPPPPSALPAPSALPPTPPAPSPPPAPAWPPSRPGVPSPLARLFLPTEAHSPTPTPIQTKSAATRIKLRWGSGWGWGSFLPAPWLAPTRLEQTAGSRGADTWQPGAEVWPPAPESWKRITAVGARRGSRVGKLSPRKKGVGPRSRGRASRQELGIGFGQSPCSVAETWALTWLPSSGALSPGSFPDVHHH